MCRQLEKGDQDSKEQCTHSQSPKIFGEFKSFEGNMHRVGQSIMAAFCGPTAFAIEDLRKERFTKINGQQS
jgi:hypothetical protein